MLRAVARCCGHWLPGTAAADGMLWQTELRPHAAGEFSMAAAQANLAMEDQAQVLVSLAATLVGVYDCHGGADASRFLRARLHRQALFLSIQFVVVVEIKLATRTRFCNHDKKIEQAYDDLLNSLKQTLSRMMELQEVQLVAQNFPCCFI